MKFWVRKCTCFKNHEVDICIYIHVYVCIYTHTYICTLYMNCSSKQLSQFTHPRASICISILWNIYEHHICQFERFPIYITLIIDAIEHLLCFNYILFLCVNVRGIIFFPVSYQGIPHYIVKILTIYYMLKMCFLIIFLM